MATVVAVFAAGILAFVSPCFLPIVPVVISQFTGVKPQQTFIGQGSRGSIIELKDSQPPSGNSMTLTAPAAVRLAPRHGAEKVTSRRQAMAYAVAFVLSFSLVFAALWAAVGAIGWIVGDYRRSLTVIAGAALILMGLHTARFIRIPFLDQSVRSSSRASDGGPSMKKSIILGLSFGAGWSPCIGPILGGVLALATAQGTALQGFALLLVFCAGLGLPLIVGALLADGIGSMAWVKKHYKSIEIVLGLSLVIIGFMMIAGLLERLAALVPAIM